MFPIDIIELDLHKVPFYFIVPGKQIVKDFDISMIRKTEITDAPRRTFADQKIEYAIVQIASFHGFHSAHTDAMKQHIIKIIYL